MDNWEQIGAALVTIVGIIVGVVAKLNGVFDRQKSERQQDTDAEQALAARRDKGSLEGTEQTIANVFQLVTKLQGEIDRKDRQLADQETRCAAREKELQNRIIVHEEAIARQAETIATLRRELFELKQGRRE